jgi:hypothetical protein
MHINDSEERPVSHSTHQTPEADAGETLNRHITISDDADLTRSAQFLVAEGAYGIRVDLLDREGESIASVLVDYFNNRLSVKCWNKETQAAEADPSADITLVEDVAASVQSTVTERYLAATGEPFPTT